ncbi:hypothetical protein FXN61_25970 [Lentzea sp. PSKA42]|uniref:Uncharacterized protein n=1 Tax=Lentzea indica TaxID=2604800 RepID=A0ABX1FND7_9PSEU|nr:hypothetical protein [Lentzea indica]
MSPVELAEAVRTVELLGVAGPPVLDDMPAPARAALHLRAARSLRTHGATDRVVADHLLETSPDWSRGRARCSTGPRRRR